MGREKLYYVAVTPEHVSSVENILKLYASEFLHRENTKIGLIKIYFFSCCVKKVIKESKSRGIIFHPVRFSGKSADIFLKKR